MVAFLIRAIDRSEAMYLKAMYLKSFRCMRFCSLASRFYYKALSNTVELKLKKAYPTRTVSGATSPTHLMLASNQPFNESPTTNTN